MKSEMDMTFDDFHNRLRILSSIDAHELRDLDTDIWTAAEYAKFRDNPWSYFIKADDEVAVMIWNVIAKRAGKPQREGVSPEFLDASAKAAIRALRGLEETAIMLETYAPEIFPDVNVVNGVEQRHFGRVMMESAAQSIRDSWKQAIREVEIV